MAAENVDVAAGHSPGKNSSKVAREKKLNLIRTINPEFKTLLKPGR
jgi:hypothetical protein